MRIFEFVAPSMWAILVSVWNVSCATCPVIREENRLWCNEIREPIYCAIGNEILEGTRMGILGGSPVRVFERTSFVNSDVPARYGEGTHDVPGWNPTCNEMLALEEIVRASACEGDEWPGVHPTHYFRQYYGIYHNGARILLARFICPYLADAAEWSVGPITVMDGGSCLIEVEFNVDEREILKIATSGVGG